MDKGVEHTRDVKNSQGPLLCSEAEECSTIKHTERRIRLWAKIQTEVFRNQRNKSSYLEVLDDLIKSSSSRGKWGGNGYTVG